MALLVTAGHLWLADVVGTDRFGLGAAPSVLPARMQVAFVRDLAPRVPPSAAPSVAPAVSRAMASSRVLPAAAAASQPSAAVTDAKDAARAVVADAPEDAPADVRADVRADAGAETPAEVSAAGPTAVPVSSVARAEAASASATAGVAVAAAAGNAASAPAVSQVPPPPSLETTAAAPAEPFAWPPSTRLSYALTGHYRGPVEGQAQVEWLLQGARYQVHMDLSIGPTFAPLASRRVSSDGLVTSQGLSPRRYDEVTRALLRQPQHLTVWLDEDIVRLANGRAEPRPVGVQDSASQFVHLTWLFTTQPALLRAGQSLTLPLALPRQLEPWVYDVVGAQTLATPAGDVDTFHVKPRRPPRSGNDLTAEIWVAPSLQYLPVRILIRQDADTYLDLLMARLPQQAALKR